uniref:Integrin alpha-L isoform X1 n=1 Tax=Pogona vitticeps TaxID=103695 RepID=A0ABM5EIH2_9SAUR
MASLSVPIHFLALLAVWHFQGQSPSQGYNVEITPAARFSNVSEQFGYQVLQIGEGSEARIIVGAPAQPNSTGKVYQCSMESEKCTDVPLEGTSGIHHMGMTLASNMQGSKMIACGPGVQQHCDKNLYVSGLCYMLDAKLQNFRNITTGYQKCLKGNVDLVFLFDGSESMTDGQFNTLKDFMINVMEKLYNSTIHFAAVQFSQHTKIEFDFNGYINEPNPRKLLAEVQHMKHLTNTFSAIKYVMDNVFLPERGMREGSNKVIVIITDGLATDKDKGIIAEATKKGILRLIIGVGVHFNSEESKEKIRQLASAPFDQTVKLLTRFEDLKNSFDDLQSKIFAIEGTSDTGSFHMEMSSSGFSADINQGRIVLGAVGADNWAGGLLEQQDGFVQEKFVTFPLYKKEMEGAYLGYALKYLQRQQRELYAVGAPRYQHVGRVIIFEINATTANWTLKQEIKGEQTGSYFGGVLCAVDIDMDQETDLLLVGAHLYFTETRGGNVSVYGWEEERLVLRGELHGDPGYPLGRFGAAITDLEDINGDGLTDVAVGAPLEDDEKGAVYIYNGHEKTLLSHYSQRITGAGMTPGLKFFGQSIHGKTDLSKDGLIDITVGALGEALVLRSRPIVTVVTHVKFWPKEIRVEDVECLGDTSSWRNKELNLTICFSTSLATSSYKDFSSASLLFHLEIDPNRMKNRGVFRNGKKDINGQRDIAVGQVCVEEQINITNCIEDYISAIKVVVNFSLKDDNKTSNRHPKPVLNPLSNTTTIEIPFEKNCGTDGVCIADMRISFSGSGPRELVVSPQAYLDMNLELENLRENAYYPVLRVPHMPGLSFRKVSVLKSNTLILVSCDGMLQSHVHEGLSCNISHPVYRNKTKALIQLRFGVLDNSVWGDHLEMQACVQSDNEWNDTALDNTAKLRIPVKYPVNIIAERMETSTHYVNFTFLHQENKTVTHSYNITNWPIGTSPPPAVSVFVKVPTEFPGRLIWDVKNIQTDPSVFCQLVPTEKHKPSKWIEEEQCAASEYHIYSCDLGQINSSIINVTGVMFTNGSIEQFPRSKFCTALWLTFDTERYKNFYGHRFAQFQVTEVEVITEMNYLPIIIGSGIGGLLLLILIIFGLYKCGFFKRNYKQKMDLQEENETALPLEGIVAGDRGEEGNVESDKEKEYNGSLADPLNREAETQ